MKMEKHEKLILVDADVIIHLSKAERLTVLKELFEGRIYVLDYVIEELKLMAPFQLRIILGHSAMLCEINIGHFLITTHRF